MTQHLSRRSTSVDLPAPITLEGSFAELRHGVLTIGFSKLERQIDIITIAIGESLAKAHKQHLRADKLKARSSVAKEYAKAAREHVIRASKKQERTRHFLVTARSSKALLTVPPVPNWTEEMPHSPVD